jgi:DNA-binding transcriptional LysR family regulator
VPVVCVVPAKHRLAGATQVQIKDLEGENFISFGLSDPLRIVLDQKCAAENVARKLRIDAHLASSVMSFVANGAGISVVDALSAVTAKSEKIAIIPFALSFRHELSIYRPRQAQKAEITSLFSDHLLNAVKEAIAPYDC